MNQTQNIVTGIVYTKNKQRAVISTGPDDPLGDSVIVNGLIYGDTDFNKPAIGVFDLSAVTTPVGEKRERHDVSVELSFNKSFARRSWISKLQPAFKPSKQADDINLSYGMLRLLPDLGGTGIGEFVTSNYGWVNTGWSMAEYRHRYATDFGFGAGASDYSQLVYQVEYRTSAWYSFWKLLIPLLIVMAMVVGATKLDPAQWEVRLTLPVTVLLTLVFLQQGYSAELPRLPYLTFIDEIYVVAYSLTLGSFGLMLWGCRRYYRAMQISSEPERQQALRQLDLSDDAWPAAVILVGMVAVAVCWITA